MKHFFAFQFAFVLWFQGQKLRTFAFDFLSGNGDFIDLEKMLFPSRMPAQWTYEDYQKEVVEFLMDIHQEHVLPVCSCTVDTVQCL